MGVSRRAFLGGSAAGLAGLGLASLTAGLLLPDRRKRLLCLRLVGGSDGLQAVIPHGDPGYGPALRPSLHVPRSAAHELNGFASLHPALGDLRELFRDGELAVVHRVGPAAASRSHLVSRELWEGWLGSGVRALPWEAETCARVLLDDAGPAVVVADLPGWDTHTGAHVAGMASLAAGLRSLRRRLARAGAWDDTVVVTLSEFGRASRENAWGGTEHGAASCLFVAGGAVRGGVHGCDAASWLQGILFGSGGDALLERTDPRAVLGEVLRGHLGMSAPAIEGTFPGYAAAYAPQEIGLLQGRWFA